MGMKVIHRLNQVKHETVTMWSVAAASNLGSTTKHYSGTTITVAPYSRAAFVANIIANSTGTPSLTIQGSWDGTTWYDYATLHSDLTTTANAKGADYSALPPYVRGKLKPYTTTVKKVAFLVKAELYV